MVEWEIVLAWFDEILNYTWYLCNEKTCLNNFKVQVVIFDRCFDFWDCIFVVLLCKSACE